MQHKQIQHVQNNSHRHGIFLHNIGIKGRRLGHANPLEGIAPDHGQDDARQLYHAHELQNELDDRRRRVVGPGDPAPQLGKVVFQKFAHLNKVALGASAGAEQNVDGMFWVIFNVGVVDGWGGLWDERVKESVC